MQRQPWRPPEQAPRRLAGGTAQAAGGLLVDQVARAQEVLSGDVQAQGLCLAGGPCRRQLSGGAHARQPCAPASDRILITSHACNTTRTATPALHRTRVHHAQGRRRGLTGLLQRNVAQAQLEVLEPLAHGPLAQLELGAVLGRLLAGALPGLAGLPALGGRGQLVLLRRRHPLPHPALLLQWQPLARPAFACCGSRLARSVAVADERPTVGVGCAVAHPAAPSAWPGTLRPGRPAGPCPGSRARPARPPAGPGGPAATT